MGHDDLRAKIAGIITAHAKADPPEDGYADDAKLVDDVGLDSARLVDVWLDLEDAFSISIDDGSFDGVQTFGDLTRLVEQRLVPEEA